MTVVRWRRLRSAVLLLGAVLLVTVATGLASSDAQSSSGGAPVLRPVLSVEGIAPAGATRASVLLYSFGGVSGERVDADAWSLIDVVTPGVNLVSNEGLEVNVAGFGAQNATLDRVARADGAGSMLRATALSDSSFGPFFDGAPGDRPGVAAGHRYVATVEALALPTGRDVRLALEWTDATGAVVEQTSGPRTSVPGQPVLAGEAQDGTSLTTSNGVWDGGTSVSYDVAWQRCNADGAGCADIVGATEDVYELAEADIGATVRSNVTATNGEGSAEASSRPTAVVAAVGPTALDAPTISGRLALDATLRAESGSWTGTGPLTFSYQFSWPLRLAACGG